MHFKHFIPYVHGLLTSERNIHDLGTEEIRSTEKKNMQV